MPHKSIPARAHPAPRVNRAGVVALIGVCGCAAGLGGTARAAVVDSQWAAAVDGLWGVSTNWTPQVVPSNGVDSYNVTLLLDGPYTVSLDADYTINDLNILGDQAAVRLFNAGAAHTLTVQGSFSLNETSILEGDNLGMTSQGTLSVTGAATLNGGTVAHVGQLNLGGDFNLAAKTPIDFDDTHVDHSGAACMWSGGNNISLNNSSLTFESGSTFAIQTGAALLGSGVSTSVTLKPGSHLVKQDPTTTATTGVSFVNTGSVEVQAGTLSTDGVALTGASNDTLSTGKWTVRTNSTLTLGPGQAIAHNQADVTLDGEGSSFAAINGVQSNDAAGLLTVSGGRNFTTAGAFNNNGTLTVGAGSDFKVKTGAALGNITGGTLSGGSFHLSGRLLVDGANVTTLTSNLTFDGANAAFVDGANTSLSAVRSLANVNAGGEFHLLNGSAYTQGAASLSINSGATFDVGIGSTLTIPGGDTFTAQSGSTFANIAPTTTGGAIVVSGTLKTPTAAISTIGSKLTLERAVGQPVPQVQSLSSANALANVSTVANGGELALLVDSGATPTTYTTTTPSFNVANGGNLTVGKNAILNIPAGTLANIGSNTLDLGRFTLQGQVRTNFTAPSNLTLTNTTTLDGPGSSIYDITTNTDLFSSLRTIDTGGTLTLLNGRNLTLTQPLTVKGTLVVGSTPGGGRPGDGSSAVNTGAVTRGEDFETLTVGGDLSSLGGSLTLDTGRLSFTGGGRMLQPSGSFFGSGQVGGDFLLAGNGDSATISPGIGECNYGTITILNNLNAGAGSVFQIDVGTQDGHSISDIIEVLGTTTISPNSVLDLRICNDFVPSIGEMIPVIDFGSRSGSIGAFQGLVKSNGISFTPVYSGSELFLQVQSVPGPGGAAALMLGGLGLMRRRMQATLA